MALFDNKTYRYTEKLLHYGHLALGSYPIVFDNDFNYYHLNPISEAVTAATIR
jgi:hypothetical protein